MNWLKNQLKSLKSLNEETIMFYLDTGNTFHIPKYYEVIFFKYLIKNVLYNFILNFFLQFKVPLASPDLFGDLFVKHCMSEVSVIGVSGASSK